MALDGSVLTVHWGSVEHGKEFLDGCCILSIPSGTDLPHAVETPEKGI